jgi:hypothetical protein
MSVQHLNITFSYVRFVGYKSSYIVLVYLLKHVRPVAHNQPPRRSEHERLRLLAAGWGWEWDQMHQGDMDEDDDEESVRVGAKSFRAAMMGKSRKKRRKVVGWADLMC